MLGSVLMLAALLAPAARSQQASFEAFRPAWATSDVSFAWVGDDGDVAIGNAGNRVLRWSREDGLEDWGGPGRGTHASADGRTIMVKSGCCAVYKVTSPTQWQLISDYGSPYPAGISANASTLVYGFDGSGGEGALSIYRTVGNQGSFIYGVGGCDSVFWSIASGLSVDGNSVAGYSCGGAFVWTLLAGSRALHLNTDSYWNQSTTAISRNGQWIAGLATRYKQPDRHFLSTPLDDTHELLPPPVGTVSGISDNADLSVSSTINEGWIWTPARGSVRVQEVLTSAGVLPSGWIVRSARSVAATARWIAGEASSPAGVSHAYIARIPPSCPADRDWSGTVDMTDFDLFLSAFIAGSPDADVDLSGFVDTDDFDAFVVAFERGC